MALGANGDCKAPPQAEEVQGTAAATHGDKDDCNQQHPDSLATCHVGSGRGGDLGCAGVEDGTPGHAAGQVDGGSLKAQWSKSCSALTVPPEAAKGECRICLSSERQEDLVSPCHCTGSVEYAHLHCLQAWVVEKRSLTCELCGKSYLEPHRAKLQAAIPTLPPGAALRHEFVVVFDASQPRTPREQWRRFCTSRSFWWHLFLLALLIVAILYLTVLQKLVSSDFWTVLLWRVIVIVLPLYMILRVAWTLHNRRIERSMASALSDSHRHRADVHSYLREARSWA